MTTYTATFGAPRLARRTSILSFVLGMIEARKQRFALASLDDALLEDIGITRADQIALTRGVL
jgi:uncharacterized protein YjiS (DUF1127 family)